jgi:DNA-binding LytR/AlgR family response regulator
MKCIIVDDEPLAREILAEYVADMPSLELVGSYSSAILAMEGLKRQEVDLIFLDVNMPRLSGIEFIRAMERRPAVILTTAYPDYALQGYELDVVDYLLKPFSFERFLKAVQKADVRVVRLEETHGDRLKVRADKRTWLIDYSDLLCIESMGDYVRIYTTQRKLTVNDTMKAMEDALPGGMFMRVHKSWIVARSAIDFVEGNYLMCGDHPIPIGKTYRDQLMKWLG